MMCITYKLSYLWYNTSKSALQINTNNTTIQLLQYNTFRTNSTFDIHLDDNLGSNEYESPLRKEITRSGQALRVDNTICCWWEFSSWISLNESKNCNKVGLFVLQHKTYT